MNSSHKTDIPKLKILCKRKGLVPTKVIGTDKVQISKGDNSHLVVISWEEFEEYLTSRHLAVYTQLGFIKIMADDIA